MTTSQQETPTIPEGMVPWHGGENAPADFGTAVMLRNGTIFEDDEADGWRWRHLGSSLDIIAYTPLAAVPPHPTQNDDTLVERAREVLAAECEKDGFLALAKSTRAGECKTFIRAMIRFGALPPPTRGPDSTVDREAVEEAAHRVIVRWSNGEQSKPLKALIADAILALIPQERA
jgi:hypothetical protein